MSYEKFIVEKIRKHITKPSDNLFDSMIEEFKIYYDRPVHSMSELKDKQKTNTKGAVFETFCKMYFDTLYKNDTKIYKNVWLLDEVPEDIKEKLKLKKQDLGIDLIIEDQNERYSAIQVKYRQHPKYKSKNVIGWKQLSTFYALVNRTGPYKQHIIFTNADYVRHVGNKDSKDKSYCKGSLRKIEKSQWCKMANIDENKMTEEMSKQLSLEELRTARLKFLATCE